MKFTVEIELGNDAMQTGRDVAAALHVAARRIDGPNFVEWYGRFPVMDENGNTVGSAGVADA